MLSDIVKRVGPPFNAQIQREPQNQNHSLPNLRWMRRSTLTLGPISELHRAFTPRHVLKNLQPAPKGPSRLQEVRAGESRLSILRDKPPLILQSLEVLRFTESRHITGPRLLFIEPPEDRPDAFDLGPDFLDSGRLIESRAFK